MIQNLALKLTKAAKTTNFRSSFFQNYQKHVDILIKMNIYFYLDSDAITWIYLFQLISFEL